MKEREGGMKEEREREMITQWETKEEKESGREEGEGERKVREGKEREQ